MRSSTPGRVAAAILATGQRYPSADRPDQTPAANRFAGTPATRGIFPGSSSASAPGTNLRLYDLAAFRFTGFDLNNVASQRVPTRLGMRDEGVTDRWFGLTRRQYRAMVPPGSPP